MLKQLLLPPIALVLALIAAGLLPYRRLRLALVILLGLAFYAIATPFGSGLLLRSLEVGPPLTEAEAKAIAAAGGVQAIVILSAGTDEVAPELGGDAVDANTLVRLRYGALLHRQTGLPILVTGGVGRGRSVAERMASELRRDFGITARWVEPRAGNTFENARYSAALLRAEAVEAVFLVSHGWHLRRAMLVFEDQGLQAVPAGTGWAGRLENTRWKHFVPTVASLADAYYGFHEWVGLAYYRLRYIGPGRGTE